MKKINVIYNGWGECFKYGVLAQAGNTLMFEYTQEAIDSDIDLSPYLMPLSGNTFRDFPGYQEFLPGFIADALPDGWGRLLTDRYLLKNYGIRQEEVTALQRLAIVGNKAIGALSFEPSDKSQDYPVDLNLDQLAVYVEGVVTDTDVNALSKLLVVGGSPQGARPKALVRYHKKANMISTNTMEEGDDWMIKFPAASEHPEVCAIEDCYAKLAKDCGLHIPETKFFDLEDKKAAFGIERFDRFNGMRIPVLTVAGALDLDFRVPNFDYRDFLRLTSFMTKDVRQKEEAFLRCLFNVVFNNRDDHTKNFSFRMNKNKLWELSPCYDLTFCVGPNGYHQMSIMGEALSPNRQSIELLAKDAQIGDDFLEESRNKIIDVALKFKSHALNYPIIRKGTVSEIDKSIQRNIKLLR